MSAEFRRIEGRTSHEGRRNPADGRKRSAIGGGLAHGASRVGSRRTGAAATRCPCGDAVVVARGGPVGPAFRARSGGPRAARVLRQRGPRGASIERRSACGGSSATIDRRRPPPRSAAPRGPALRRMRRERRALARRRCADGWRRRRHAGIRRGVARAADRSGRRARACGHADRGAARARGWLPLRLLGRGRRSRRRRLPGRGRCVRRVVDDRRRGGFRRARRDLARARRPARGFRARVDARGGPRGPATRGRSRVRSRGRVRRARPVASRRRLAARGRSRRLRCVRRGTRRGLRARGRRMAAAWRRARHRADHERVVRARGRVRRRPARVRRARCARRDGRRRGRGRGRGRRHDRERGFRPSRPGRPGRRRTAFAHRDPRGSRARGVGVVRFIDRARRAAARHRRATRTRRWRRLRNRDRRPEDRSRCGRRIAAVATARAGTLGRAIGRCVRPVGRTGRRRTDRRFAGLRSPRPGMARWRRGRGRGARLRRAQRCPHRPALARLGAPDGALRKRGVRGKGACAARGPPPAAAPRGRAPLSRGGEPRAERRSRPLARATADAVTHRRARRRPLPTGHPRRARRTTGRASASSPRSSCRRRSRASPRRPPDDGRRT